MFCLFLDISWREGLFALFRDGLLVDELRLPLENSRHHCKSWQELLDRHQLSLSNISYFACAVGPGSFTGIRSAAATAKAVACVTSKPILPLSSLLAFVPCDPGSYQVIIDRGIGGVYTQHILHEKGILVMDPPAACGWEDVVLPPETHVVLPQGTIIPAFFAFELALLHKDVRPHAHLFAMAADRQFSSGRALSPHDIRLWYAS